MTGFRAASIVLVLVAMSLCGQTTPQFEVASVKQNVSGDSNAGSNVPLGPGEVFTPTGGLFSATNQPLAVYIAFAYKVNGNQRDGLMKQLPQWVNEDRFDIQAKAAGNPGKDDFRMMMRALLTERFGFRVHYESRETAVFALTTTKAGRTGPQLQAHPASGDECPAVGQTPGTETVKGGFPAWCGGLIGMPPSMPRLYRFGARNVTMDFAANTFADLGAQGRPVINKTGLEGRFDFVIEFAQESPSADSAVIGQVFSGALRDQLGLRMDSEKSTVEMLIVDHLDHSSAN